MTAAPRSIRPALVVLLAVVTGSCAGSMYFVQPLLSEVRHTFDLGAGTAGLLVTVGQIGYVSGLLLLVPVGDLVERRRLLTVMVVALAAMLAVVALAPDVAVLAAALVAVGLSAVAAQMTVAFAANLAPDDQRGRVVGTVMSGLLLGVLLARTVAGYLSGLGGWRTVYWVAAGLVLILALAMRVTLPSERPRVATSYTGLLRSVLGLVREEPVLRVRAVYGAASFGAFSVLWTPLAFLLSGSPYHYAASTIGLFGLVGVAGATMASVAGRIADRGHARAATAVSSVLLVACWLPVALGRHSVAWLIVGIVVLDAAAQGLHITNQSQIYALRPEARSRLTSAYMASYFVGGVVGSASSSAAYSTWGWTGVAGVGAAFGLVCVATALGQAARPARPAPDVAARPGQPALDRRY